MDLVRVNKRLKRLRLNQRLRKTLQPKNAIMVLNEMKAGVQFTFPETQGMPNSLYLVHAEVFRIMFLFMLLLKSFNLLFALFKLYYV